MMSVCGLEDLRQTNILLHSCGMGESTITNDPSHSTRAEERKPSAF